MMSWALTWPSRQRATIRRAAYMDPTPTGGRGTDELDSWLKFFEWYSKIIFVTQETLESVINHSSVLQYMSATETLVTVTKQVAYCSTFFESPTYLSCDKNDGIQWQIKQPIV